MLRLIAQHERQHHRAERAVADRADEAGRRIEDIVRNHAAAQLGLPVSGRGDVVAWRGGVYVLKHERG